MPLIQDYNKLFEYTDNIKKVIFNGNLVWPTEISASGPDYTEPFYVENITNSNETLTIRKSTSAAPTVTIEYSTNRENWNTLGTTSTTALTRTLAPGDKIYLRCNTSVFGGSAANNITGCSKIGGNINSLLWGDRFEGQQEFPDATQADTFRSVFNIIDTSYQNTLIDAGSLLLPATILSVNAYANLFRRNSLLVNGPSILPATTLVQNCYGNMFNECSSLIKSPKLPAATLVRQCYYYMFYRCTSLNEVHCYATSGINTNNSTPNWLYGVASTGTFYKKTGVYWPSGGNGIPSGWTTISEV